MIPDNATQSGAAVPGRLRTVLERLTEACRLDERIHGAWLEGSFARGQADDWSDIDLHLLVAEPADFDAALWLGSLLPLVMADEIPGLPGAQIFLTSDWIHIDLIVHSPDETLTDGPRKILIDRRGILRSAEVSLPGPGQVRFPEQDVRTFLYFMGNTVTAVRRNDLVALLHVTSMMRDRLLVQLLLAENGIVAGAGTKRITVFLSPEQLETLARLPAADTSVSRQLELQKAVASEYVRRAKALARSCEAEWPAALETAARKLWARELGITV